MLFYSEYINTNIQTKIAFSWLKENVAYVLYKAKNNDDRIYEFNIESVIEAIEPNLFRYKYDDEFEPIVGYKEIIEFMENIGFNIENIASEATLKSNNKCKIEAIQFFR